MLILKEFCNDTPESLAKLFEVPVENLGIAEIIAGWQESWCYEESIWVLYIGTDGKLYEVSGEHCSCYGLEGQWNPAETSWKYLASDKFGVSGMESAEIEAVRALAAERIKSTATDDHVAR